MKQIEVKGNTVFQESRKGPGWFYYDSDHAGWNSSKFLNATEERLHSKC